jgi:hypothetical protein
MSRVQLKLKGMMGGTVKEILADALAVAERAGCWVNIEINGVSMLIAPEGDTLHRLGANYQLAVERGVNYASGNVVPSAPLPTGDRRPAGWTEALALAFVGAQVATEGVAFAQAFAEGRWSEIQRDWPEFETWRKQRA